MIVSSEHNDDTDTDNHSDILVLYSEAPREWEQY